MKCHLPPIYNHYTSDCWRRWVRYIQGIRCWQRLHRWTCLCRKVRCQPHWAALAGQLIHLGVPFFTGNCWAEQLSVVPLFSLPVRSLNVEISESSGNFTHSGSILLLVLWLALALHLGQLSKQLNSESTSLDAAWAASGCYDLHCTLSNYR